MRNLIRRFFSAIADGIGSGISTMATTGKKKYLNLEGLTYLCSKIKDALTLKLDKSQIVQNATTAATDKVPSAAVVKNLQDQITQLNTNSVGTDQVAFVTFSNYGDYWWISSPIPCLRADQLNVALSDNVKNTSVGVNSEISRGLFEVVRHKNTFYLRTNDREVAGYIFRELHPGVVWEVHYNVAA